MSTIRVKYKHWKIVLAGFVLLTMIYYHLISLLPTNKLSYCSVRRLAHSNVLPITASLSNDMETLFRKQSRNGTVIVVPVNSGYIHFLHNFICAIRKSAPHLEEWIILWVMDAEGKDTIKSSPLRIKSAIYHDDTLNGTSHFEKGGTDAYYHMMRLRSTFFRLVIEVMRLHLFFIDGDVIFLRDPVPWLLDNDGYGKRRTNSFDLDIIYSMDPKEYLACRSDPLETDLRVPKICGGLFYARSTPNTILLFKSLDCLIRIDEKANDQWSMDEILNSKILFPHIRLAGDIPHCLIRHSHMDPRFCPRRMQCIANMTPSTLSSLGYDRTERISNDELVVRVLDETQFATGEMLGADIPWSTYDSYNYNIWLRKTMENQNFTNPNPSYSSSLLAEQVPVSFHGNWWFRDKVESLRRLKLWFWNDQEQTCTN